MAWHIKCSEPACGTSTWARDIVQLLDQHRDESGWFRCTCGHKGYIEKDFKLQEPGETWKPFLRGAIRLGADEDTYQPFSSL